MKRLVVLASALVALLLFCGTPAQGSTLVTIPVAEGASELLWLADAPAQPSWVVLLFCGGNGAVHLDGQGPTTLRGNFLMRTVAQWAKRGIAAAILDAPSDHHEGMDDYFRLSPRHVDDVAAAVAELRRRYPGSRVALIGTSRGTVSVGSVLEHAAGTANAYVLTSAVTQRNREEPGLSGVSWPKAARVMVLANAKDSCPVSAPGAAQALAEVEGASFLLLSSDSGQGREGECEAYSPHGFLGIESEALQSIALWLGSLN